MVAYLKLLATPADEIALLRIINTPPRGIGQSTVTALMEHAVRERRPMWEMLSALPPELKLAPAAIDAHPQIPRADRRSFSGGSNGNRCSLSCRT